MSIPPPLRAVDPVAPPVMRMSTALILLAIAALVAASFLSLPIQWSALSSAQAWHAGAEFVRGFAPPDLRPDFLYRIGVAAVETLSMSALGTGLAAVAGLGLALPASGRFGNACRIGARTVLNGLRAVPELVWAALLLIAAGLGPFAGTLALAIHTAGVLGRLFADALENASPLPEATLRTNGARAAAAFLYATLPQIAPQIMSYTLYRWENNIRAAAVLGVVGAGGLGQMLKYHLSLFQMQQAATVILAMMLLVGVVDAASYGMRRHLMR